MKRIIVMALAAITLNSCESETAPATNDTEITASTVVTATNGIEVPMIITNAFNQAYPGIDGVNWKMEDSLYKASFNNTGLDMAVVYHPDGQRYAVVAAVATEYLPEAVLTTAKTLGPVMSANKITMKSGTIRYEVMIRDEDYFFDESGAMIQEHDAIEEMKKAL